MTVPKQGIVTRLLALLKLARHTDLERAQRTADHRAHLLERTREKLGRQRAARSAERRKTTAYRARIDRLRSDLATARRVISRLKTAAGLPQRELPIVLPLRAGIAPIDIGTPDDPCADQQFTSVSHAYADVKDRWQNNDRPDLRRVSAAGLWFSVPTDAGITGSLSDRIASGWLPFEDIARVRQVVVGGVMLDIGANVGTTCIPRIALGDFARAYAAEPQSDNYRCLVGNVVDNRLQGRVFPDRVAISSSSGIARLRRGTQIGTHRLLPPERRSGAQMEEVQALTLDEWLARLAAPTDSVTFVKVDTQGWDVHVLAGAQSLLQRRGIVWQIEVSPSMMKGAGSDIGDLLELVRVHFTDVRVLGGRDVRGLRPSHELPDLLTEIFQRRRFANLLLLNTEDR